MEILSKSWKAEIINHRNTERIAVYFKKSPDLIERFKKMQGAKWSQSLKVWHLPNTQVYREQFNLRTKEQLSSNKIDHILNFKQYLQTKRYSDSTIKTYTEALKSFLIYFNQKEVSLIDNIDVVTFQQQYIIKNKLYTSYQNQIINAVKLYFKTIRHCSIETDKIYRPKREKNFLMF